MNAEASQPTCPSPERRITLNPFFVTMLRAVAHAIHFKRILNFGEGQESQSVGEGVAAVISWITSLQLTNAT
jgi:hypothetical protein